MIQNIKNKPLGFIVKLKDCGSYGIFVDKTERYIKFYRPMFMDDKIFNIINNQIEELNQMTMLERNKYLEELSQTFKIINKFSL